MKVKTLHETLQRTTTVVILYSPQNQFMNLQSSIRHNNSQSHLLTLITLADSWGFFDILSLHRSLVTVATTTQSLLCAAAAHNVKCSGLDRRGRPQRSLADSRRIFSRRPHCTEGSFSSGRESPQSSVLRTDTAGSAASGSSPGSPFNLKTVSSSTLGESSVSVT